MIYSIKNIWKTFYDEQNIQVSPFIDQKDHMILFHEWGKL